MGDGISPDSPADPIPVEVSRRLKAGFLTVPQHLDRCAKDQWIKTYRQELLKLRTTPAPKAPEVEAAWMKVVEAYGAYARLQYAQEYRRNRRSILVKKITDRALRIREAGEQERLQLLKGRMGMKYIVQVASPSPTQKSRERAARRLKTVAGTATIVGRQRSLAVGQNGSPSESTETPS